LLLALIPAEDWKAILISLQVSLCAASLCLPVAVAAGWFLARTEWRGRWLVETLVNLPLVMPPIVTGFLLLILFSPSGWIGYPLHAWFGWDLVLTWQAAVLASLVVSFPLAVRPIQIAFQSIDPDLELAARTLGAGPWVTFCFVSLPLAKRGLAAGWLLAFARSLGEFGATIMVAGNILGETRTIPLGVFSYVNSPDGIERAWPLVTVSVLLSCFALFVGYWIERRQERRSR